MAPPRWRPFLDTNVLFSGLHRPGLPSTILELHAGGEISVVISRQVLEELVRTIRRKHPAILPLLGVFMTSTPPEICDDPSAADVQEAARCINAKDAPILAAALKTRADCLVSGNTRHFTPEVARCAGISILTPAVYLAELGR